MAGITNREPKRGRLSRGLACRLARRRLARTAARGGATTPRLARHLDHCECCREYASAIDGTWALLYDLRPSPPPTPDVAALAWRAAHGRPSLLPALSLRSFARAATVVGFVALGAVGGTLLGERLLGPSKMDARERVLSEVQSDSPAGLLHGLLVLPGDPPDYASRCGCP